jgi:hypothetical protein
MKKYSKLASVVVFISAIIVLILGIVKSINSMIIGGVISIMGSAMIFMCLTVQRSIGEPVKSVSTNNPLPDV